MNASNDKKKKKKKRERERERMLSSTKNKPIICPPIQHTTITTYKTTRKQTKHNTIHGNIITKSGL